MFGHSATTLWRLEPVSKQVSVVGEFDCLGELTGTSGMADIAVDENDAMVGVAQLGLADGMLVSINQFDAGCTELSRGKFPNSLTYVPAGVLDSEREALVGYSLADYTRIDPVSGETTVIGSLNPNSTGELWKSSGDIVSLVGGKTYLTVVPRLADASHADDTLVEVDPVTGKALRVVARTGLPRLWGLGFWAGTAYLFSANGSLTAVDVSSGALTPVPVPGAPADLEFWGAGVTTRAPVEPPR